jgi:hypothetical protein
MDSNSTSSLLHAFLDGELDQTHEKPLFEELASSNELRAEMRDLLAIRSAVQHDVEAFSPPFAATNNVFSTLGFSLPTATPVAAPILSSAATTATAAAATSWWNRLWLPATTLLIGAGITYLLLNWGYTSALAAKSDEYNRHIQEIRNESDRAIARATANAQQSAPMLEPTVIVKKVYYPVVKYRDVVPQNTENTHNLLPSSDNLTSSISSHSEQTASITHAAMRDEEAANGGDGVSALQSKHDATFFAATVASTPTQHLTGYSDETVHAETPALWFKFNQNTALLGTTTATDLQPQDALLNNFNGELAWMLSPSFSIGVKVGREAFPMSYSGTINGRVSKYSQYSSIVWGGISAQVRPAELSFLGGMQPYFSTMAGGSELGPLVRGELGLQIPLTSYFSVSAGTDATGMFYQFQGTNFSTWKFGINTGVTLHF